MILRFRPLAWPLALAAAAVTCSSDALTLPSEGLPDSIEALAGGGQTAPVATSLPDSLIVRVTDSKSRPVEGVKVAFTPVLGGGDAVPDTGFTDVDGRTGARWTLGTSAGDQRLRAAVVGPTSSGALTTSFGAIAVPAAADTMFAYDGDGQVAVVGSALADSLVVRVTDQYGNAVSGRAIAWRPTGGGSVSPASSTTGVAGTAATQRTLGSRAGPQGAAATSAGLKGSPVEFIMSAVSALPTALVKVAGDNQTAVVASAVPESLVVRLLDADANGVPGVNVTFAVATGGGSTSPTSATTNADGRAATQWTLGTSAGSNLLVASSAGFSVSFQATGTASAATTMLANSAISQSDTAGSPVGAPPSVKVTDIGGNPVADVAVAFEVTGGGGSIAPGTPISTDAAGIATLTTWALGSTVGLNTVTASVAGLLGSPVTFSATGVPGAAARLQVQTQPSPSAVSGVPLAVQPAVQLADAFGNAVSTSGSVITAALALGSGTGTLGGDLTATTVAGFAVFTDLAITGTEGPYTIRFTSGSLVPDTSNVVTVGVGVPSKLGIVAQPSATAQNAVEFAQQPTVQVLDVAGDPVAGVRSVSVLVNAGGGVLGGATTVNTDAAGLATFSGLSITGTVGPRTLEFTSNGLTPVISSVVTTTAGVPTEMAIHAGDGQSAPVGTAVSTPPSIIVGDVSSNPVPGVAVTFAVTGGGGSVLPITAVFTNASGIAAASSWTLGPAAGGNSLTATAAPGGIGGNPATFTATGTVGPETALALTTAPATGQSGVPLAPQPVVRLVDENGNTVPTSGTVVSASLATGSGSLGGTLTASTVDGVATFTDLVLTGTAGNYTIQFSADGLTGITTGAIALSAGSPIKLDWLQQPTSEKVNASIKPPPKVQVLDGAGNLVTTATTSITVGIGNNPGGSTLDGTTTHPAAAGVATFSGLKLNHTGIGYTLIATASGLTSATSNPFNITQ